MCSTVTRELCRSALQIDHELAAVRALMERYANVPMSLADACLVRLGSHRAADCTIDSDFAIYRRVGAAR